MKTMRTIRRVTMTAATLLTLSAGLAPQAEAGVRIRGDVRLPNVSIRIGDNGVRLVPNWRAERHHFDSMRGQRWARKLSHRDYDIAWRLSYLTGVSDARLLRQKARGMTWKRIVRQHRIAPQLLRVARSEKAFARYLLRHDPQRIGRLQGVNRGGSGPCGR